MGPAHAPAGAAGLAGTSATRCNVGSKSTAPPAAISSSSMSASSSNSSKSASKIAGSKRTASSLAASLLHSFSSAARIGNTSSRPPPPQQHPACEDALLRSSGGCHSAGGSSSSNRVLVVGQAPAPTLATPAVSSVAPLLLEETSVAYLDACGKPLDAPGQQQTLLGPFLGRHHGAAAGAGGSMMLAGLLSREFSAALVGGVFNQRSA